MYVEAKNVMVHNTSIFSLNLNSALGCPLFRVKNNNNNNSKTLMTHPMFMIICGHYSIGHSQLPLLSEC